MAKNMMQKYLPYIILGGIILILGGILVWQELNNIPRNDIKSTTTVSSKVLKQQTISTNTVRLSNGNR